MATADFDVIIIGSGATGGVAAKEFAEAGFKTLMLERGRPIEHGADYRGEMRAPWERPYGGRRAQGKYEDEYGPYQGIANENNEHFWLNYKQDPYIHDETKPFIWFRAGGVGGKSLMWGRQCYRWSDLDFEANKKDGHGIDWPIRYADIAPWYSHVERFAGISGERLGLPHLPDGEFLPPMALNAAEKHVKAAIERHFPGRYLTIGRVANLTEPMVEAGRANCQYRNQCGNGCSFGAYFSTQSSTLPAARATGNLTLRPNTVVASLDYDPKTKRVTGVRAFDAEDGRAHLFRARVVFLCASAIASTQILMNSRSEAAPHGLGGSSGALGRYLMDHTWGTRIQGTAPQVYGKTMKGRRPNGIYIPRFRNLDGQEDVPFVRGYGFQGGGVVEGWAAVAARTPGFGEAFKKNVQSPGRWTFTLYGFAECLPYKENRMMLDDARPDRFGIPQVRFDCSFKDNEYAMARDMIEQGEAMLKRARLKDIRSFIGPMTMGLGIHEMGTARMGADPSDSVLNKWNQVHEAPNVFVTDGACMTSSSCVNPTITYMALTARAASHAAALMKEGAI